MSRAVREGVGFVLLLVALAVLFFSVTNLVSHDYVAALLTTLIGLSLLQAGVELLRPSMGE